MEIKEQHVYEFSQGSELFKVTFPLWWKTLYRSYTKRICDTEGIHQFSRILHISFPLGGIGATYLLLQTQKPIHCDMQVMVMWPYLVPILSSILLDFPFTFSKIVKCCYHTESLY